MVFFRKTTAFCAFKICLVRYLDYFCMSCLSVFMSAHVQIIREIRNTNVSVVTVLNAHVQRLLERNLDRFCCHFKLCLIEVLNIYIGCKAASSVRMKIFNTIKTFFQRLLLASSLLPRAF